MPHQCTNCGRTFPDGSKEMLSGCPDCDGNRFQFAPDRASHPSRAGEGTASAPAVDGSPSDAARERPDSNRRTTEEFPEWPETARRPGDRSDARSRRRVGGPSSHDRPSLEELRKELNDQFESIRIVRPGEYELNLMELYDREEYIISLREDGRYVIDVPESWRSGDG